MATTKTAPTRTYEFTYLVGVGYTSAETAAFQDQITTLVGKHKGKIEEVVDWGKKLLAYPIKHEGKTHTEANYHHLIIEMPADKAKAFSEAVKLKREIIRSLIVVR
ncbi:MAG: 30S ribosomal protein S6 [Pseudomonadales bacterium]|jgi:ribosomal protein S6|nr:30S ribosomal protein S6 [Pseudomonadales bacterium]